MSAYEQARRTPVCRESLRTWLTKFLRDRQQSVYCCRSPTQVQSSTSRRAYRVRCRFLCFAATLPVLFSVCHRSECKSHRERIKAVAASSRLPSQIVRSSSKQTTFCTDALLNDLGDASVFDGERVVVCVAHFLRHVVQPTNTVG